MHRWAVPPAYLHACMHAYIYIYIYIYTYIHTYIHTCLTYLPTLPPTYLPLFLSIIIIILFYICEELTPKVQVLYMLNLSDRTSKLHSITTFVIVSLQTEQFRYNRELPPAHISYIGSNGLLVITIEMNTKHGHCFVILHSTETFPWKKFRMAWRYITIYIFSILRSLALMFLATQVCKSTKLLILVAGS